MSTLHAVSEQFRLAGIMIDGVLNDLTNDDLFVRSGEACHGHWILGHMTATRRMVRRMLKEELPKAEWEAAFSMGSKPAGPEGLPSAAELTADFKQSGDVLMKKILGMSADDAAEKLERPFAAFQIDTIGGALAFMTFHEAYHMGQIGLIRRVVGKKGVA